MSFIKIKQYCVIARNGVVASLNLAWLDDAPTPQQQALVDYYFICLASLKKRSERVTDKSHQNKRISRHCAEWCHCMINGWTIHAQHCNNS